MRYDRIFTKLFCQPLLVEDSFRVGLEMALFSLMRGEIPSTPPMVKKVDPERSQKYADNQLEISGETAVIHIDGAIDKNLDALDRISFNATDLNDIDRAIARVASNMSIKNVMFAIDSPGGSVPGVPETATKIAALSREKNTAAFLQTGCSAAYWLACQVDQVFACPSSSVGSIGVYCAIVDQSRRLEEMGVHVETVQDGKLKTAGAPWKPLSESERASIQSRINQIGEMFRAAVTSKRPEVERATMEGQSFLGQAALDAGLIDHLVGDLAEAIARAF